MHFATPGKIFGRVHAQAGKFLPQLFGFVVCPPGIHIGDVDADHEIAGELRLVEVLQNEPLAAAEKADAATVLLEFDEPQLTKQLATF